MKESIQVKSGRRRAPCPEEAALLDMMRTCDLLSRGPAQVLKTEELSATQYNVLRILRGAPQGLPCGEIANRMVTRDPDITRLLDRLEKRELISRSRETKDRRMVMARITPAGLKLLAARDAQRDPHLKSPEFFHIEKFPTLSFKSTDIRLVRDGELAVEGDLTIRGVTRKVLFAVDGPTPPTKDPWGGTRVAVSATTKINRKDFGLTRNAALETGGILVGDEVTITLDAEFLRA